MPQTPGVGVERETAVAKIITPDGVGTGFLVKVNNGQGKVHCVMTNQHVLCNKEIAARSEAVFGYTKGSSQQITVSLNPDVLFLAEESCLDVAIVAINESNKLTDIKEVSLKDTEHPRIGDVVHIVQHPNGGPRLVNCNKIVDVKEDLVYYHTPTAGGSSGAPVFVNNKLVALHTGSTKKKLSEFQDHETNCGINIEILKRRYLDSAIKRLKFWSGNREGKRLAEQFAAEHSTCTTEGILGGSRFVAGSQGDNNKCPQFVIVIALLAGFALMCISMRQISFVSNEVAVVLALGIAAALWFVRSSLPNHAAPLTLPTARSGCDAAQKSPQEHLQRTGVSSPRASPIQLPNVGVTPNQCTVFHANATRVPKPSTMDNNVASAPESNAEELTATELRWLLKEGNQNPFGTKDELVERLINFQPKRKMPTSSGNTNSPINKRTKTTQSTTKRKR